MHGTLEAPARDQHVHRTGKMTGWLHPRSSPPRGDLVLALTGQHIVAQG